MNGVNLKIFAFCNLGYIQIRFLPVPLRQAGGRKPQPWLQDRAEGRIDGATGPAAAGMSQRRASWLPDLQADPIQPEGMDETDPCKARRHIAHARGREGVSGRERPLLSARRLGAGWEIAGAETACGFQVPRVAAASPRLCLFSCSEGSGLQVSCASRNGDLPALNFLTKP